MKPLRTVLTAADLASRSFHDNAVHAWHLTDENPDEGTCTLTLDIDHITQWIEVPGRFEFDIVPGLLSFYGVFRLKMEVDYSIGPIGVTPFQMDRIEQTIETREFGDTTRWRIPINCPSGSITFEATGWSLVLVGDPVRSTAQTLVRRTISLDV
jgi:hypothetical protein